MQFSKQDKAKITAGIIGLFLIIMYKILEALPGGELYVYQHIVKPIHVVLATACDSVPFSVAEVLIAIVVIGVAIDLIRTLVDITKKKKVWSRLFSFLLSIVSSVVVIYGLFCILWGVYYSVADIEQIVGIHTEGVKHQDLIEVDWMFAQLANEYSSKVTRDSAGCTDFDIQSVVDRSEALYDNVSVIFPGLEADAHRPKKVYFSEIMSYMDFTGFFFPFTAEANINVHSPDSMIPVTIAHEMAHQRGIAAEDEANFTAVIACMESGDTDYIYSASLLALIHLQNALYKSGDMDAWQAIRDSYSQQVCDDLAQNSGYWNKYRKSVVYKASNSTYDAFLKSYNQTLGTETYGACVDLLVEYYH